ncbi:MAG: membrane protein insertion efficiency factor YidD [Candidatus Gracilibacteria bacterium]
MKKLLHYISAFTVLPFQLLIRLYQITISPDHSLLRHLFPGGFCRFTPSCSSYAHTALGKYGLIRGSLKAVWRILRCNPWSKGGIDLP